MNPSEYLAQFNESLSDINETTAGQITILKNRLAGVDDLEFQSKAVLKIEVFKRFGWMEGYLSKAKRLFLVDKILQTPVLSADIQIELIKSLDVNPISFWSSFSETNKKDKLFYNDLEVTGFLKELDGFIRLGVEEVDKKITKEFEKFSQKIK